MITGGRSPTETRLRNGDVVRIAFTVDAFDREIIAWTTVTCAGIGGSDVRDMMLDAVA